MGTAIQRTVVDWRSYISEPWQKAVENIVETGRRLLEAKKSTSHGDWEKIFENNEPFSERTAQRLMAIARHPILAKAAHGPLLPPSWRTLYELSLVPEPLLLELMQDTRIHPDLKRSEVKELVKEIQPPMLTEQDVQQRVYQAVAEAQRKAQEQEKAAVANARETTKVAYTELVADLQRNLKITKDYYVDDMRKLQEEVKKGVAPEEVQKKIDAATLALKNQNVASNKAISELQAKIGMLEKDKVERAKELVLLQNDVQLPQPKLLAVNATPTLLLTKQDSQQADEDEETVTDWNPPPVTEETIEGLRQLVIIGCMGAIRAAPCGSGCLEKGQVTQEVIDAIQKVIDVWTQVKINMLSLMKE